MSYNGHFDSELEHIKMPVEALNLLLKVLKNDKPQPSTSQESFAVKLAKHRSEVAHQSFAEKVSWARLDAAKGKITYNDIHAKAIACIDATLPSTLEIIIKKLEELKTEAKSGSDGYYKAKAIIDDVSTQLSADSRRQLIENFDKLLMAVAEQHSELIISRNGIKDNSGINSLAK